MVSGILSLFLKLYTQNYLFEKLFVVQIIKILKQISNAHQNLN